MKRITFPGDKATTEWLDSQKSSTRSAYVTYWKHFLEFTGMTGDQILADRKKDKSYSWEKKTLEFKAWMMKEKKKAETSAATSAAGVRSFFSFHRLPLKFRRGERQRLTEAEPKYEDYRYSREELAKMASVAGLKEKYVLVVGKSFGLRAGDFLALTRGGLEAYLDREPPISIGEYATHKEKVPAYPMIDRDALPVIKLMLENMDRQGKTKPNDKILNYKDAIQLTRIIQRLTERAGIEIGNKRVRFHCLRKFLIDRLSSYMSTEKWKQIVGKTIGEGAYVSPDSLRKDYARAMDEICFSKAVTSEGDLRIKTALDQLRLSGKVPEERIRELGSEWLGKPPEMAIRKIGLEGQAWERIVEREGYTREEAFAIPRETIKKEMEEIEREQKRPKTATNGGRADCQRIVEESELAQMLAQGWRVAAVLPSGKVVVESPHQ